MTIRQTRFSRLAPGGGLGQAAFRLGSGLAQHRQLQKQRQIGDILAQAGQPMTEQEQMLAGQSAGLGEDAAITRPTEQELIQQAKAIDPLMAMAVMEKMGMDTASKRAEASRFAAQVQSVPPETQDRLIQERAATLQAQGRDPRDTLELIGMSPEQRQQALTGVQLMDLATKERLGLQAAGVKAGSKAGLDLLKQKLKIEEDRFKKAKDIRSEISKVSVDFNKQRGAWGRVQASAEDPSAAGDLALIFNFMKVLDPGSTVREGEFATAQNAGGVNERIASLYNNILEGTRLTPKQRADFLNRSKKLFNKAETQNKEDVGKLISIGKRFGVAKEDLLGIEDTPEKQQKPLSEMSIEELRAEQARLKGQ